jgi:class 3 adenylate cyclase/tetratricopeptide (TPR) repeat protein
MRCSRCGSENPDGAKFCDGCAAPLVLQCPSCGTSNRPSARFCIECAAALGAASSAGITEPARSETRDIALGTSRESHEISDGERKTVTALFADIKGSMELMEDLDPEEARAIVDPALKLMMDAVHHYGGYVAQSTGDGIFALFGAPVAHEDHPQRALYAALKMQEEMRRYSARLREAGNLPIEARVGVNTGEVVVRSIATGEGHAEYTPIGHSTSLAARMQALAPTGSIAVTNATRKLCEGYFAFKPLGPTRIKGVHEPVEVYEVTGLGPLRTRLQRSAGRGLTKFVGREREMEALKRAAELAKQGHGQVAATVAEAGVGKSRLFFEFKAASQSGWMVLEAFSVSHGKASAYFPVIDLLHGYFKITGDDDPRTRREKVAGRITILDRLLEDTLPYLFGLLGIVEGEDPLAQMDGRVRKRRTLEAIKRILLRESINQPLMVIFEDLHWIDEQTQEFLNLLADSIGTAKILLLVNYRPEYLHKWNSKTYYTQLRLDPLGRESAEEMLTALLGDSGELAPLKRLIIERTEGTPFFMEETVQVLFDEGALDASVKLTKPLAELKIPPTVQAILAARIDRLPPDERDLLQTLAVIGKEFPLSLAREVSRKPDDELNRMLDDLQLAEFVYEQPAVAATEYTFKHALTQEVAYNSMLSERRKLVHERAGAAIEELYAERLDDHLSELARHYERSGNSGKALEYLQRAGDHELVRSCHAEAVRLFTSALELLNTRPETPERLQQELRLQLGRGSALSALKGWAARDAVQALARANELSRKIGSTPQLFRVLRALVSSYLMRGELRGAYQLSQQLLGIAEESRDATLLVVALSILGGVLWGMGEFTLARSHLERAISLYDPAISKSYRTVYQAFDAGAQSLAWAAINLCCLGYPDRGLESSHQALALARKVTSPMGIAITLRRLAQLQLLRGEASLGSADECLRLATQHAFEYLSAHAMAHCGSALIELNQPDEGIVQLKQGIAAARTIASEFLLPSFLGALSSGYNKISRVAEGLAAVSEGLALSERTGERWYDAELHRLRGELLLKPEAQAGSKVENEVQACFRQALEIARRQQAKWWELRATMSLARLLRDNSRRDEARAMLAEIYGWFTEGFDTADLKDAKALLDELKE